MSSGLPRSIFIASCLIGLVLVATAALVEISRHRRHETYITPVQFRLRMFNAVLWLVLLGSSAYAVTYLWPVANRQQARQFLSVMSGVFLLLMIALLLLLLDVMMVVQQQRKLRGLFDQRLRTLHSKVVQEGSTPVAPSSPPSAGPAADGLPREEQAPEGPRSEGTPSGGLPPA